GHRLEHHHLLCGTGAGRGKSRAVRGDQALTVAVAKNVGRGARGAGGARFLPIPVAAAGAARGICRGLAALDGGPRRDPADRFGTRLLPGVAGGWSGPQWYFPGSTVPVRFGGHGAQRLRPERSGQRFPGKNKIRNKASLENVLFTAFGLLANVSFPRSAWERKPYKPAGMSYGRRPVCWQIDNILSEVNVLP